MKEEYMRGALCVTPKEKVVWDLDWNWFSVGGIGKESCCKQQAFQWSSGWKMILKLKHPTRNGRRTYLWLECLTTSIKRGLY